MGSLQPPKGQDEAIMALAKLIHRGINIELSIVGTGNKKFHRYLTELVKYYGIEKQIIFHGYVDNPLPLIHSVDIVLVCSRFEAFGRVTVEAMLAGKPVVGTNSGGTKELIKNGDTGLLYQPGNKDDLSEKIEYLYNNPIVRRRIGSAAQTWARERFNRERYSKEVFGLLHEILIEFNKS